MPTLYMNEQLFFQQWNAPFLWLMANMNRSWKYNQDVSEYYIETDEKTSRKIAEMDKTLETTELEETW